MKKTPSAPVSDGTPHSVDRRKGSHVYCRQVSGKVDVFKVGAGARRRGWWSRGALFPFPSLHRPRTRFCLTDKSTLTRTRARTRARRVVDVFDIGRICAIFFWYILFKGSAK